MSVPEASINKDTCPVFWKHEIRFARQSFGMKPVSKAHRMQAAPYE